ncbi:MAG: non-canonical purine NTP pyrophosphatase, RdgB/HAM1 family [Deltaproteobacteria bacterium RIFCSPLOWO2_02_FULL_44_10]|nr:MAG: non-canonical purine NTP pyrophosphatase, RdgB/HAM1 family [Deltaproteobacteria bacterium RIFCSPHIGHO2_02_FULL_44_16]OGQ47100.1 MAG: non-canonical purine NTP pyrophosphatase, RdgB/HAM1 family [Deltaproteobacteria bacterium RIFCSPLOWO2_02_FULL_44_10]
MKLLIATRNPGKLRELQKAFGDLEIEIVSLETYPDLPDVDETEVSFLANARKKAEHFLSTECFVLADDSGICVDVLDGAPGVHSARWANAYGDQDANNQKLLQELREHQNRKAHFTCALVLMAPDGRVWEVEGKCEGEIAHEVKGKHGFGYDPIFYLPDKDCTMAELTPEEKFEVSHRGEAIRKIREILVEVLKPTD